MVEGDDGVRPRLLEVLDAPHLEPVEGPEHDRQASRKALVGRTRRMAIPASRLAMPTIRNWPAEDRPAFCRSARPDGAEHDQRRGEHVRGGDDPGAALLRRPGLERGEGRHDEQGRRRRPAARSRGRSGRRARRSGNRGRRSRRGAARRSRRTWARSRETRPMISAATGVGSITIRPAQSQEARPEPSATPTENIASKAVTTDSSPPKVPFTSAGRRARTTAPMSQNQLVMSPFRHSRAYPRRVAHQAARRAQHVAVDRQGGRRLAGPRDQQARQPAQDGEAHDDEPEGMRPRHG